MGSDAVSKFFKALLLDLYVLPNYLTASLRLPTNGGNAHCKILLTFPSR
jgi:hypothetical protein